MEVPDQLLAVLKDLKCIQLPSNTHELLNLLQKITYESANTNTCNDININGNANTEANINGNAIGSREKRQLPLLQKLEELTNENERLRIQNLTLMKQIEESRKENERLRLQNETLVEELQGIYRKNLDSSAPDLLRRTTDEEQGEVTRNCAASDGHLNIDVAKRILATLEELPVHVSYNDADLRRIWFNHSVHDFSKKDMLDIETAELQSKMRVLETGESQTEDIAIKLPKKGHMVRRVKARPHFNEHGAVVGVSLASVNITEQVELKECLCRLEAEMSARRATEDKLRQAMKLTEEAIQAKNVFLAIMSHEIRTPLNGLLGLAEALETSELNAEQKELVSTIHSSGVIIADILGDILDLASMEFGMLEFEEHAFNPSDLIEDIVKMAVAATHEKDITVRSEVADNVPNLVICDPLRVRQVMKYLVLNAIKFTQKGTVSIYMGVKSEFARGARYCEEKKMEVDVTESLQSMEEKNIVTGTKFKQEDSSLSCLSKTNSSLVSLLDTTLFQMKVLESSGTSRDENRCAVVASNNAKDLQGNIEKLASLREEEDLIAPGDCSVLGQSSLQVGASAREEGSLKHTACDGGDASEDLENSENEVPEQHLLYCEIKDTGVGIPKEAFGILFDKFTQVNAGLTRNYGGTGLGLAICKQLVELMGGQLTVESKVGKGSKFTFTVKCKVSEESQIELRSGRLWRSTSTKDNSATFASESLSLYAEGSSSISPLADSVSTLENNTRVNPRILLAEDNKVNVMVAISMLKRLGFTAKVVANGIEALEAIRKERYDLILLDICMPLMDGLQVAYAVRKFEETGQWPDEDLCNMFSSPHCRSQESGNSSAIQPQIKKGMDGLANALDDLTQSDQGNHIPIVAVTANALRSEIDKCFACGMDAFIAKPVVFQKLQEILEKYLPQQNSSLT